jgi:hypothetical protein
MGTVTKTGGKAALDTALGTQVIQPSPFYQVISINSATLQTGPAGSPFALTQNSTFMTSGLFDLSVPSTPGGLYQVGLSDRVAANQGGGDILSMQVHNCIPLPGACSGLTGPYILLTDANFTANTSVVLGVPVPLDTANQQILFELTKPDALSDTVDGYYEYFNNGVGSGLTLVGSFSGLFTGPGDLGYTQAGFVQLAPVPEPSSLALLASSIAGVAGLLWCRRRKVRASSLQQATSL